MMEAKAMGTICSAWGKCCALSRRANTEATAAATIPRGASRAMKVRSRQFSDEKPVQR